MSSNVGNASTYEAADQRTKSDAEVDQENKEQRFEEGMSKKDAHKANDAKDERSIANRLEKELSKDGDDEKTLETRLLQEDATLPARSHGNKPSRGAIIDQELKEEEEAILKKKGAFGPNV